MLRRLLCCICALTAALPNALAASLESRSYMYNNGSTANRNYIERTNGALNCVCPDYYHVGSTGLLLSTRTVDEHFVAEQQENGIKVLPSVNNHWDRDAARAALKRSAAFAAEIATQVSKYGFDGIDIDIENINESDKDSFLSFITTLRSKLPAGKILSIAVPANPYALTTGWQGGYDYAKLAAQSDILFMMTYDENVGGTAGGPVASLGFIEKSISYALARVPASKIMYGLPFYGRYWRTNNGSVTSGAFIQSDILRITEDYPSELSYSTAHETARAKVTVTGSDAGAGLYGGKKLSTGVYDIWYENDNSLQLKLALCRKYGLRGVGSWALGQESGHIWEFYSKSLYGSPYTDIAGHWAEPHIRELDELGMINGVTSYLFGPDRTATRAEAAVLIARLLDLPDGTDTAFSDTAKHWANAKLSAMKARGVLSGFPDGSYRPDKPISREELAAMLDRILHVPNTIDYNEHFFSDINPHDNWSNNAIVTLRLYGVIDGYSDGTFRPGRNVTRAETVKMLNIIRALPMRLPVNSRGVSEREFIVEPR